MTEPNVILLTIDALRADRVTSNGYKLPTTPHLDMLLDNSISPTTNYSLCPSTIGAFPSIMTSTRPLSYGGFDNGAFGRPQSLTRRAALSGYRTVHITPVHWVNGAFGYWAEQEITCFSPQSLTRSIEKITGPSFYSYIEGDRDISSLEQNVAPFLDRYFQYMKIYCKSKIEEDIVIHLDTLEYRWREVSERVSFHEECWRNSRIKFLKDSAESMYRNRGILPGVNWKLLRSLVDVRNDIGFRTLSKITARAFPALSLRLRWRQKQYPDAERIVDRLLSVCAEGRDSRPVFVWAHLFDTHIPYSFGTGKSWVKDAPSWLRAAGHDPSIDPLSGYRARPTNAGEWERWSAAYDAAVCFVDFQVGRLRVELENRGMANTIIAVTSDHGEELGDHGGASHNFRLYEHNTRTHALVFHPDISGVRVPSFATSLDIAPTIVEMIGAAKPSDWEGRSFSDLQTSPRQSVVLESCSGSPFDPRSTPLHLAYREQRLKLIWTENVTADQHAQRKEYQLFDVLNDPGETEDLAEERPLDVERMRAPLFARAREVKGAVASPNSMASVPKETLQ